MVAYFAFLWEGMFAKKRPPTCNAPKTLFSSPRYEQVCGHPPRPLVKERFYAV
jgi:hypothetical protein